MIFSLGIEYKCMPMKRMEPDRKFGSADDLFSWSRECKDIRQSERFMAIRMLMQGRSREEVMEIYGISWSTLQRWVKLWNKGGKEALIMGKPTGRPSKLTPEAKDFLVEQIEFTNRRTGKKVTAIHISGVLEKKVRDKIKSRVDSLLPAKDGLLPDKAQDNAPGAERRQDKGV
jgi:transposase